MYDNDKYSSRGFGDSSQLTNWILDPGEMCHMTPQGSGYILGCYKILINILKLWMGITSRLNKKTSTNKNVQR